MKIVWTDQALANLISIREYIAEGSEQNAIVVSERILECVRPLATQPEIGRRGEVPGTRQLVVPRTPYVIVYRIREGGLRLLAVLHGRQQGPESFEN
ncbi:MAG: type II toxin-antitoxin system RelE/ParE family toxin [Acidobacteria bacterium]|nr:type II toxin-antitoxin system RelE/ParE family toxin [Acidobacteriota bacterium]